MVTLLRLGTANLHLGFTTLLASRCQTRMHVREVICERKDRRNVVRLL